jgi:rod shape-determining protein MreC
VLRRRAVAVALVVVSLALLTVYFRESSGGSLHGLQSAGSTVLRPFEVAATRVAQPFRDAAGWVGGLSGARSENKKLKREVADLKRQLIAAQGAMQQNQQFKKLLHYQGSPSYPQDYHSLPTSVISRASGQFDQRIVVGVGSKDGVELHDPVVTPDGLVGQVTRVYTHVAQVTLITDESSYVSVVDLRTGAAGLLRHNDSGSSIILDSVPKSAQVSQGDAVVTAGWHTPRLSSIFPRDIPVGTVSSVSQTDIDPYKQIEVTPFVDFGSIDSMDVLIKKAQ